MHTAGLTSTKNAELHPFALFQISDPCVVDGYLSRQRVAHRPSQVTVSGSRLQTQTTIICARRVKSPGQSLGILHCRVFVARVLRGPRQIGGPQWPIGETQQHRATALTAMPDNSCRRHQC